ncbi:replication protein A 70 kDa DNA-binding subunit B-like [Henckelia pumila]|uniref:replication protein A 70 kDa DNA-binding subunit B-like n=1 Tax=Henckelia pumila TaxID=405737 RepID=UPI003C6E618C
MASSSTRPVYSSMEEKCTTLGQLNPNSHNWFVKVLVAEKTPIRNTRWGRHMKLVFVDKESIIYGQDLEQLDKLLDLYKTYFMGNAKIRQIAANTPILAASEYQMVLNRSTYIKLCSQQEQLPITNIYQLTRFAQCSEFADVASKQINLLCAVIHVFPPRFVQRTRRNLQDFVIVNEEHRPMLLTLWEEFLQNEGPRLSENVHKVPVILGIRLSVNTFYGKTIFFLFHRPKKIIFSAVY